jgi:hypothetical protein
MVTRITIQEHSLNTYDFFFYIVPYSRYDITSETTHHPAANGLMQSFHWMLKATIMCHMDQQWTEVLPLVLLGIHMAFKADLKASVAELVYGESL